MAVTILPPASGESFDCVAAGALGVSFGWLRGNTPVTRAFPVALRAPRLDCPDSRPAYGYLPIDRDGDLPYTPSPLFVQDVVQETSAKSVAQTPPAPRAKGVVTGILDALRGLLPEHYEEVVTRFQRAFAAALPHLPQAEIVWRMHFMFGAMSYALAGNDALKIGRAHV